MEKSSDEGIARAGRIYHVDGKRLDPDQVPTVLCDGPLSSELSDYQRVAIGKRIQTSNYVAAAGDCRDLGFVGEEHVHFGQSIDQIPRPFFGGIVSAVERCSEAAARIGSPHVAVPTLPEPPCLPAERPYS